jgi:hypothetical protein
VADASIAFGDGKLDHLSQRLTTMGLDRCDPAPGLKAQAYPSGDAAHHGWQRPTRNGNPVAVPAFTY